MLMSDVLGFLVECTHDSVAVRTFPAHSELRGMARNEIVVTSYPVLRPHQQRCLSTESSACAVHPMG